MPAPVLIILPHGLNVSGVTLWALRLTEALSARGWRCGLLLHPEPEGQRRVAFTMPAAVRVFEPPGLPPLEAFPGNFAPYMPAYREAVRAMRGPGDAARENVIVCPGLLGDCYGLAAALTLAEPDRVRVVGWQHSDLEYDTRILVHYEPMLSAFVGVSRKIHGTLRQRLPTRPGDVHQIPYGVPVPETVARRPAGGPIRLIYTGRLEHRQKRVLALPALSRELSRRGIDHRVTIVGDGPALADLEREIAGIPSITRLAPVDQQRLSALLAEHHALVLPSRYEGLSVAMLEAMACGCVPIVARTESGAGDAIDPGVNGEIADVPPDADEPLVAAALADAVARAWRRDPGLGTASAAARRTVHERYSLGAHADAVAKVFDAAAFAPARAWPADRPCAFSTGRTGLSLGGGSVPAEGPDRLREILHTLRGKRILVHGTGRHSRELADLFADSPAAIAAFADDDRQKHGRTIWNWAIVAPADAARTGATDVIISSWMNQDEIWSRREVYEAQGLRVHRLYDSKDR